MVFYARQRKIFLFFKHGRDPFLFCADRRPAAPVTPSSRVMLLRKHAQGRHIRSCSADALARCLYLLLSGNTEDGRPVWLCLDLRRGPRFEHFDCPPSPDAVAWPDPEELGQAITGWGDWPALTPALRRTLPLLEKPEQRALLADLAVGGGDIFVYGEGEDAEIFAWPLPESLRRGRAESVFEDIFEATALIGTGRIFGSLDAAGRKACGLPWERKIRRLQRLLVKLDAEEDRLRALADRHEEALALQAELWRYPADTRYAEVFLPGAAGSRRILLDPRYTLREHMERRFHEAGRGRRGLALLEKRREEVRRETVEAERALRLGLPPAAFGRGEEIPGGSRENARGRGMLVEKKLCTTEDGRAGRGQLKIGDGGDRSPLYVLPKNIQGFRSSDGFVLLRGRDAEGNTALLRLARPDDLWLHAEGGPGAHVLIRCGQKDVPESSLREAAQLAAVKSLWRESPTARILCARAGHVRPVKNGKPGMVCVEKQERLLEPAVDVEIEMRLERM